MPTTTPKIELIYDPDCPNVERARERLSQAVAEHGQALAWTEWRSEDPALPNYARGHGSPTILIDQRDVAADHPHESSCRLYDQGDGTLDPAPPVTVILTALRATSLNAGRQPIDAEAGNPNDTR